MKWTLYLALCFGGLVFFGCNTQEQQKKDNFDRRAVLENWSSNLIIPHWEAYFKSISGLQNAFINFKAAPSTATFEVVRESFNNTYLTWQDASPFDIGKGEFLKIRNYSNIYPTDVDGINAAISSDSYDLELPSMLNKQGLPALDYLIYEKLVDVNDFSAFEADIKYMEALISRLHAMTALVVEDWKGSFRTTFVENDGSSATSSVNSILNDMMFYYEKHVRAAKVGIPAGVFSAKPLPEKVEGYFSRNQSKAMLSKALETVESFFGDRNNASSLYSYLTYLKDVRKKQDDIGILIEKQFGAIKKALATIDNDFVNQVESNNADMLLLYDAMQQLVVLMKVDMFQVLDVKVDYVDADGD